MYVSLMGKMGSYLDVANERKELARSALTTEKKRGLRRHFDTEAEFSTWVAGVEGDAWGDLLTLHHIAMTWSLTILVVQPGACPMVGGEQGTPVEEEDTKEEATGGEGDIADWGTLRAGADGPGTGFRTSQCRPHCRAHPIPAGGVSDSRHDEGRDFSTGRGLPPPLLPSTVLPGKPVPPGHPLIRSRATRTYRWPT